MRVSLPPFPPPFSRSLVCMDARINPAAAFGLKEGDAHVIRNAGGRASDDAIRSFVISHKLLGTKEWFVIHHTDCGMEYFKSSQLAALLEGSLATASIVPDAAAPKGVAFVNASEGGGCAAGHAVHWLHIDDQAASVKEDVAKIAGHELVAPGIPVHGYMCVPCASPPPPAPLYTHAHHRRHFFFTPCARPPPPAATTSRRARSTTWCPR